MIPRKVPAALATALVSLLAASSASAALTAGVETDAASGIRITTAKDNAAIDGPLTFSAASAEHDQETAAERWIVRDIKEKLVALDEQSDTAAERWIVRDIKEKLVALDEEDDTAAERWIVRDIKEKLVALDEEDDTATEREIVRDIKEKVAQLEQTHDDDRLVATAWTAFDASGRAVAHDVSLSGVDFGAFELTESVTTGHDATATASGVVCTSVRWTDVAGASFASTGC